MSTESEIRKMCLYEIRGRQFTNAIDCNIDQIQEFDSECIDYVKSLGFEGHRTRIMQPVKGLIYCFGGIYMERHEFDARIDLHYFWCKPDQNSIIKPKRGPEKDKFEYFTAYQKATKPLQGIVRIFDIAGLPSEPSNWPLYKCKRDSYYFVVYPSELDHLPRGIRKVTSHYFEHKISGFPEAELA